MMHYQVPFVKLLLFYYQYKVSRFLQHNAYGWHWYWKWVPCFPQAPVSRMRWERSLEVLRYHLKPLCISRLLVLVIIYKTNYYFCSLIVRHCRAFSSHVCFSEPLSLGVSAICNRWWKCQSLQPNVKSIRLLLTRPIRRVTIAQSADDSGRHEIIGISQLNQLLNWKFFLSLLFAVFP